MSSSLSPEVELWLSLNDITKVALSIPVSQAITFAINPLKWLRYLGFAIAGQKGYLPASSNGPEIDDYNAKTLASAYYFVSQGEPHLIDVDAMDGRTSIATPSTTSSATSSLSQDEADFGRKLLDRDGTCAVTGNRAKFCHACHIIPHSKGSDYMLRLSHFRGGIYDLDEPLDDINDPSNGLLLNMILHKQFGGKLSAFLKTPNFPLTVDDIPYLSANENSPASRITLHHFVPGETSILLKPHAPHNKNARQPQDTST